MSEDFKEQKERYAQYRPSYPMEFYKWLQGECLNSDRAWDCATGTGQVAIDLVNYFEHVIATDINIEQINNAGYHPRIKYAVESAETSNVNAHSLDLVTVACGVHWFNHESFYQEVKRHLKPNGIIAVWTYE